ncbi:MAG: flagellar protein FliS [Phycisphaeraceae bacterium]|nr:flagellar protein FliS [Phycisphaeraceae bacterium]MCW5755258.1 flagellar protein FliS [Phycisphaeraceae bacterium]
MNPPDTTSANTYLRTRVLTASPEELRLMLLDGAVKFARQGREAIERKDYEGIYSGVSQCRSIVAELITSIRDDVDPTLAERVRGVYMFLFRELLEVGMSRDGARLDRVIELLEYERETWALVIRKLTRERSVVTATESAAISVQA